MVIIENIIDKYYFYSKEILWLFFAAFMIFTISGFIYSFTDLIPRCLKAFSKIFRSKSHGAYNGAIHSKINRESIRYNINKLIFKMICSAIIAGIGELLCLMGVKLEIEYVYFNAVVFIIIVGAIVAYGILLCFMFRQILLPMRHVCRYIQFFIFLELFLLADTQHLEILEWVTATMGIISAEVLTSLLEKLLLKQKGDKEKGKSKKYDYPDPDLYPTRKKQLERFLVVLKEQRYEPYAVMVSGEWGTGKTSFVQALEKASEKDCFKWIYAGCEKNVSEIMSEISAQIVEVLKENNIFLERKDLVEKYFLAFSDLLEDTALKPLKKISGVVLGKNSVDEKEYLNSKLDELDKVIYLIIDDLDRCGSEYHVKVFKVIRESMELHNCKTIVLVDKTKFFTGEQDANYIEKYVNYTLDLCEVDYSEIVQFVIEDILDDKFIQNMNAVLLRGRSAEQIREIVYKFPSHLIEKIENEILIERKSQQKKKDDELNRGIKKVEELEQAILRIKKDISISRKVKNYLKGIKRAAEALNNGIEMIGEEFLTEDWFGAIIKVQYVKNFMPEVFNDIKMNRNIFEFCQKYTGYTVDMIFDLKYGLMLHNEKQEILLNLLIYKIDVIDFSQVKTECERRLFELHNNRAVARYIKEYIDFAQTYDDLEKILDIYEKQEFNDEVFKNNYIGMIFEVLSQQSSPFKANTKEFLDFSKRLMECLVKKGLSEVEKIMCVREGSLVIRRAIVDNARLFINILSILFDITTVSIHWNTLAVSDVNEFYDVLKKIDKETRFKGLEDETDKLLCIEKYYENLEIELRRKKYKDIGLDIDGMFSQIKIVFEICKFWDNVKSVIDNNRYEEQAVLFKKYFTLDGYMLGTDMMVDVFKLMEALGVLREFYMANENNYKSDYSLLFLRLSYSIIEMYETNPSWFGDKKKEIARLLKEVEALVCKLDKATGYYAQDTIDKIKIYVYRFNENCESEATVKTEDVE